MPRRSLTTLPGFADVSPEVGDLDVAALEGAFEHDPDRTLSLVVAMASATDPALRDAARRLANRLFWRSVAGRRSRQCGTGRLASTRHDTDLGDLDLERSLDAVTLARATGTAVDPDELWVRSWRTPATAWCLVLDRSGSMHGEALATAALTTAAVLLRAGPERAVVAFADDVVVLASMADGRGEDEVIDRVLSLRGDGTTELARGLRSAADQLGRAVARRRVTVLLSDCRATRADDVVAAAALHEQLVILAPADDPAAAHDLARRVGARVAVVTGPSSVPAAVADVLDRP